jgi:hypothetical protein
MLDEARGFAVSLGLTLAVLALVVVTGLKGRVALHVPLVVLTLALLGTTIYFAEQLGEHYDLRAAGAITPVHVNLAKVTTAAYLAPIATGIATLRDRSRRRLHLKMALVVLGLTVLTAATGTLMLALAPRIHGT